MAAIRELWTPPRGMETHFAQEWAGFYRKALDLYGVTPAMYRDLYIAQKGRCWICRKAKGKHPDNPTRDGARRLGIDHNHVTGAVRGLLCTGGDKTCNRIIGWLTAPALERAARYLDGTATPALVYAWTGHDMEETMRILWSESMPEPADD